MWHGALSASCLQRNAALSLATASVCSWASVKSAHSHSCELRHLSCETGIGGTREAVLETLPRWIAPMVADSVIAGRDIDRKAKMQSFDLVQRSIACQLSNLAIPPAPPSGHPSRLRLATYNVHFMRDNSGQPNSERVLEAVRAIDADVVAMQEVALPLGVTRSSNKVVDGNADGFSECLKSACENTSVKHIDSMEGSQLAREMFRLGYEHVVYSPSFVPFAGPACVHGNAVFSRRPLIDGKAPANQTVTLDLDRKGYYPNLGAVACTRCAAIAIVGIGEQGSALEPRLVTIASAHLDVLAEFGTYFGLAEGEFVRLLEFENLNHATRQLPNVIVAGDFNAPAKSTTQCTPLHERLGKVLEQLSQSRDAFNQRHFIVGDDYESPRLKDEWSLTALEFAERRLGYHHAWQLLQAPKSITPPLYSHWSGQLIDHCLFRDSTPSGSGDGIKSVTQFVGVYHTDASDHLPLIVDIEFSNAKGERG